MRTTLFDREPTLRVGIPFRGEAPTPLGEGGWLLSSSDIGRGFHWKRGIRIVLPGDITTDRERGIIINSVPVEKYLECVVGSEMNPEAPIEFLKAHAIVSRSWALHKTLHQQENGLPDSPLESWEDTADHSGEGFDVCNDDHCQRYQGLQPLSDAAREAIGATRGRALLDSDGNLADARFSKCCGGKTEIFSTCWQEKDFPYLVSQEDPWCDLSRIYPEERTHLLSTILKPYDLDRTPEEYVWDEWEAEISAETLRERVLATYGRDLGTIIRIEDSRRGPSGRIRNLRIIGENGELTVGKELPIRRLLSPDCLMSSNFTATTEDGKIRLRGRGWGHGVGLCQIGAAAMAHEGASCEEILQFYYPATKLKRLYD